MIRMPANWLRRTRFFVLEKLVLPLIIVPLRVMAWSWRRREPDAAALQELMATPRAILATYHGMFLQLLAYTPLSKRRLFVVLTPSLDGKLLAAALRYFGIDHLAVARGKRGVAGSREFARRLNEGDIAIVAVDGPRGPAGVAQAHVLRLAQVSQASVFLAITSAPRGIRFGSWDRACLPLPFSRIECRLKGFENGGSGNGASGVEALQAAMMRAAREINSPIPEPRSDAHI
jgi:lysophospholipid acyltransferase (LPLAT)-like uncharacterized protein